MDELEFDNGRGRLWTSGRLLAIADADAPQLAPATLAVYEWAEHWLRHPDADAVRVGTTYAERVEGGLFRVQFANRLGLAELQPLRAGLPICEALWVEVISPKFPSVAAHLAFLQPLLGDLITRAAGLPFALSGETARGVAESLEPPTPLFALHFLARHAVQIVAAWEAAHARPHRALTERSDLVPLPLASEADPEVLLIILHAPERWTRASGFPLATALRGYAPTEIWQRLPEETLDTPENRFVRAFLRLLLAAAESLTAQRWWPQVPARRRAAIMALDGELSLALANPLFAEVGEMQRLPTASRVLMRREGYRELLDLWRRFQLAQHPLFARAQQAIDLRDIATLYEVWAFFALADEIGAALDREPDIHLLTSDEHGLRWRTEASYGPHGTLIYNQSKKGYSVWLRPDYLWVVNGQPEVALDAKFRFDRAAFDIDTEDQPAATAKHDDLHKMHTYRDALSLRASVIVYPGDVTRFYSTPTDTASISLLDVLDSKRGIGAFAFIPYQRQ
jgi:predicted component of viral defense system (DUF524 family)